MPVAETELTERELEVARLICRGFTTMEVANELDISFHTVKVHKTNIRIKLNARNNVEILNTLHMRGLL